MQIYQCKADPPAFFLDNCNAHHIEDVVLTNICIIFLSPNCTSVIQPGSLKVLRLLILWTLLNIRVFPKEVTNSSHSTRHGTHFKAQMIPSIVKLEDSLCVDADVTLHEEFSKDVIVDSMHKENETGDEDDEDSKNRGQEKQVSLSDVLDAFDVI